MTPFLRELRIDADDCAISFPFAIAPASVQDLSKADLIELRLQFLFISFLKKQDSYFELQENLFLVTFPVDDFANYAKISLNNSYQRKKLSSFFVRIQGLKQTHVLNDGFSSAVLIPIVRLRVVKKVSFLTVHFSSQLFNNKNASVLPDHFFDYNSVEELRILIDLMFSWQNLESIKKFDIFPYTKPSISGSTKKKNIFFIKEKLKLFVAAKLAKNEIFSLKNSQASTFSINELNAQISSISFKEIL